MDEVLVPVISLAVQCAKGIHYNWAQYLCKELLKNYREAQEEGNEFHYAWLFLLIVLVAWRTPEDSQFPPQEPNLPNAAKFALLWATKDTAWVTNTKMF